MLRTVLVVDDEHWLLELLPEKIEESSGGDGRCEVLTASTPEEALEYVDRLVARGDACRVIILSDYDLHASLDGIELLARFAERLPDAHRVLMSSHSRSDLQGRLGDAALHDFIEKPMVFKEWGPVLERVLHPGSPSPGDARPPQTRS